METFFSENTDSIFSNESIVLLTFTSLALILFYLTNLICSKLVIPAVNRLTRKTKSKWDDILFSPNVIKDMGQLIPPLYLQLLRHMYSTQKVLHFSGQARY